MAKPLFGSHLDHIRDVQLRFFAVWTICSRRSLKGNRYVGIELETALRSNMHDTRAPAWVALLKRVRRLIETVVSQLVERFSIEQVWARDLWHLTSRLNCKLLAHTVCRWLNRHSPQPLQFDQLVTQ